MPLKKKYSASRMLREGVEGLGSAVNKAADYGTRIAGEALDVVGVAATTARRKLDKLARRAGALGK